MERKLAAVFSLLLLASLAGAVDVFEVNVVASKSVFGPNETINLYGWVANKSYSSNGTNTSSLVANAAVQLSIRNATSQLSSYNLTADGTGYFYSYSTQRPNYTAVYSPTANGTYWLRINYTAPNSNVWSTMVTISIYAYSYDRISVQLLKATFSPYETIVAVASAERSVNGEWLGIAGIQVNGSLRNSSGTRLQNVSCTTGADGKCIYTFNAPATQGYYYLELNNYAGYAYFLVFPFEARLVSKDSTGVAYRDVFSTSATGYAEVSVSENGTTPSSGSFSAQIYVYNATGTLKATLSSVTLDSSNGYTNKANFSTAGLGEGAYYLFATVTKSGDGTVNTTSWLQVRSWQLSVSKASRNSGFETGLTAFANSTLRFEALITDRGNGSVVSGLANRFTITLSDSLGVNMNSTNATWNGSCSTAGCYEFNLTAPPVGGEYSMRTSVTHDGETQVDEKTVTIMTQTAGASPIDASGASKSLFGTDEFAYFYINASNKTSLINVSNATLIAIRYENGTALSYSQVALGLVNATNSAHEWAFNGTASMLMIDVPKQGGIYIAEISVNNGSAVARTRFFSNPYTMCASPKRSSSTSVNNDYVWQFKTTDTVYFQLRVTNAQNVAGGATENNSSSGMYGYGMGGACSSSNTQTAVSNATISVIKATNLRNGKDESLNVTASTCQSADSSGGYICTIKPGDNIWDGGRYRAVFNVTSPDGTSDTGEGMFEARAFYIYGYSETWQNNRTANVTFTVKLYEASNTWWSSSNGLNATISLERIDYFGSGGGWMWNPSEFNYNTTGLNSTTTNGGSGTLTLPAWRAPGGNWSSGSYTAIIKGVTADGSVDYGDMWFSIRNYEAYASPVEYSGSAFAYKNAFNSRDNATLYVSIYKPGAGSYSNSLQPFGETVNVSVQKILDYSKWPPRELLSNEFTANTVSINVSSPWYGSANASFGNYIINITPAAGAWRSGSYSTELRISSPLGSEGGWGWFQARPFYIETRTVDSSNNSNYLFNVNQPVYVNVTTTRDWKNSYNATDYINTTITGAKLRIWLEEGNPLELNYPTDFLITPLQVNGTQTINVSRTTAWPSGYYTLELTMANNQSDAMTGYAWFEAKAFRVQLTTSSYNVEPTQAVNGTITLLQPQYSTNVDANDNFSIRSASLVQWNYGGQSVTSISNFTTNATAANYFNRTVKFWIYPNVSLASGSWPAGYTNLKLIINDTRGNNASTWVWFQVVPFQAAVTRLTAYTINTSANVTFTATLTGPSTGAPSNGNISRIYSYANNGSQVTYAFTVGNCNVPQNSSCPITGSANITLAPPTGGWTIGSYYLYPVFKSTAGDYEVLSTSGNIDFYITYPLTAYVNMMNETSTNNFQYQYYFNTTGNISAMVSPVGHVSNSTNISATISSVAYARQEGSCWSGSCLSYSQLGWSRVGGSNTTTNLNAYTYLRLTTPTGGWPSGNNMLRVNVSNGGDYALLTSNFYIN
ncbi:MAG: hypothetical protein AABW54_02165 [Candidatus Micrarchaeota archaeon]